MRPVHWNLQTFILPVKTFHRKWPGVLICRQSSAGESKHWPALKETRGNRNTEKHFNYGEPVDVLRRLSGSQLRPPNVQCEVNYLPIVIVTELIRLANRLAYIRLAFPFVFRLNKDILTQRSSIF